MENLEHEIREMFISLERKLTSSPERKELSDLYPGPPQVTGVIRCVIIVTSRTCFQSKI